MPATSPTTAELRAWLQFVFAPGLGALPAARLLAAFGTPAAVIAACDQELIQQGLSRTRLNALRRLAQGQLDRLDPALEHLLAWAECERQAILTPFHSEYPASLRNIPVPPPLLYRIGQPLEGESAIAVVGARDATAAGCATARELGGDLARAGFSVVSGLALGIDAAAHRGALDQQGVTVAVMGCGPDTVYPRRNADLYHRIVESGTVLSEFAPGTSPRKHHFPQRNRLISGLCLGTVVVEAGLRSGSLSTARHALEQGREVFAVPGSVHSPNSVGPHQLIRDGAHLVESVQDVLINLPDWSPPKEYDVLNQQARVPPLLSTLRPQLQAVWNALEYHPIPVDLVIARLDLPASEVSAALGELEIEGHARMEGCGYAKACAG